MDFSNNSITIIPEDIVIFTDLQLFRMKNNQLHTFPLCFYKFQTLKSLDLSRNKLAAVPN
jgi:Leucine-rich repeat (LRR) protein